MRVYDWAGRLPAWVSLVLGFSASLIGWGLVYSIRHGMILLVPGIPLVIVGSVLVASSLRRYKAERQSRGH